MPDSSHGLSYDISSHTDKQTLGAVLMWTFCKCLASNITEIVSVKLPWQGESACMQFAPEGYDLFQHLNTAKFITHVCVIRNMTT